MTTEVVAERITGGFARLRHYLALTILYIFAAVARVVSFVEAATSQSRCLVRRQQDSAAEIDKKRNIEKVMKTEKILYL